MVQRQKSPRLCSCLSFTSVVLITSLWFLTNIEYIQYNLESMKYYGSSFLPISNLIVHWSCRRNYDLFFSLLFFCDNLQSLFITSIIPYGTSDKASPLFFLLHFYLFFLIVPYGSLWYLRQSKAFIFLASLLPLFFL